MGVILCLENVREADRPNLGGGLPQDRGDLGLRHGFCFFPHPEIVEERLQNASAFGVRRVLEVVGGSFQKIEMQAERLGAALKDVVDLVEHLAKVVLLYR